MGRRFLLLLLALLLILTLGACGKKEDAGDIPEESASGEENSVQEESGAEESQSSEPEPEESLPEMELPQSIFMTQVLVGMDRVYPYWEMEITDEEEIRALVVLLSTEGLVPLTKDQPSVPDGGAPVEFKLEYAGRTESYWGYIQPHYRIEEENGRGTLGDGETKYACPAETCDALMAFLEQKKILVVG